MISDHGSQHRCHLNYSFVYSFTHSFISNCFILISIVVQVWNTSRTRHTYSQSKLYINPENLELWGCHMYLASFIWNNWAMSLGELASVNLLLNINKCLCIGCCNRGVSLGCLYVVSSVPIVGSGSAKSVTRIKQFIKMNDWILIGCVACVLLFMWWLM